MGLPKPSTVPDVLSIVRRREVPHFYVTTRDLRVVFRRLDGPRSPGHLPPAVEKVARWLVDDLERSGEANIIGVLSAAEIVRIVRLEGAQGPHFAVFVEKFSSRATVEESILRFSLTPREVEVLHCVLRGESTTEMAAHLFIAETTVIDHVKRIARKTNASKRSEIIATVLGLR